MNECGKICSLFYVKDYNTKNTFLIDTGAEISVLPANLYKMNNSASPTLTAANGSKIKTWGHKILHFTLGRLNFKWKFVIAAVDNAILGSDFLRASGLLVDIKGCRLVNADTLTTAVKLFQSNQLYSLHLESFTEAVDSYGILLSLFPTITTPTFKATQVKHGVQHTIKTEGPLPRARARRLEPHRLVLAKAAFNELSKLGIVYRSKSCCSSALEPVNKPDGSIRCCGDYGPLNAITQIDKYPIPHLQDFSAHLFGCKIFSKIDLIRGYHQIPMAKGDRHKTAIITPFGLYEYSRMPFGLKNAAQTFQRLMDTVTNGLDFVFVYLDDILVASQNKDQHLLHLKLLFQRLSDYGLAINPKKCQFGKSTLIFLGHLVTTEGIKPDKGKIQAIKNFPKPTIIKSLQEFIGMINFYNRFIKNAAYILKPLYDMLQGKRSARQLINWTQFAENAFEKAKEELAKATILAHPKPNAEINVTTDASDIAVGAVLQQFVKGKGWQSLGFFSKKLRDRELKYSAYDKELLAIQLALRHFRYSLEGRTFIVYTDHKPLTFALSRKSPSWSMRQQRTLAEISEYTTNIQHISGKDNLVADTLSRVYINAMRNSMDYESLAKDQVLDPETTAARTAVTGLKWEDIPISEGSKTTILCDVSTGNPRPFLPKQWRKKAFETIHNLSHPSIRNTVKMVSAKFIWHGMKNQVKNWAKTCLDCQRAKIHRHTKAPLGDFPTPMARFSHIHVDIVGPLPQSQGFSYLLTIVDRFTRWPDAYPLHKTDSISCAKSLLKWISRYGVPTDITSDRGTSFVNQLWSALCNLYGTKLHHSTSYHPQSNGLVERFHRHLKSALTASLENKGCEWIDHLPWVMLGIRTAPKEDMQVSSAEMVYGTPLIVPGEFLPQSTNVMQPEHLQFLREKVKLLAPMPVSKHGITASYLPPTLNEAQYVFIRQGTHVQPLQCPYKGPYKVLEHGTKTFLIDYGGVPQQISIDRLKVAHTDPSSVQVEIPPKRGRPPRVP